jgi:hypothetical protein
MRFKLKAGIGISWAAARLLAAVLSVSGCTNPFAPRLDDGRLTGDLITEQATPEEVLTNFRYAYTFKDSLLYAGLLDSAFVFQYFDPDQGPSGLFISWTREVDLVTTGRLLRSFDIINLEWLNTVYSQRDTVGNDVIESLGKSFHLDLASADFSFNVSGYAQFTFRFNPQDRKWRILQWVDQSDL